MMKLGGSSIHPEKSTRKARKVIAAKDGVSLWRGRNDRHLLRE